MNAKGLDKLKDERDALMKKTQALEYFINHHDVDENLSQVQMDLLFVQYGIMGSYVNVLTTRIDDLEGVETKNEN